MNRTRSSIAFRRLCDARPSETVSISLANRLRRHAKLSLPGKNDTMQSTPVDRPIRRTNWRQLALLILLCAVLLWNLRHGAFSSRFVPSVNGNRLLLSDRAQIQRAYDVVLNRPVEFDFLTRAAVLQLRCDAVAQHPRLIHRGYRPSHAVFGQMEDGLPWWGDAGQYFYGSGVKSIEGPSEESRYIVNPLLLVAVDLVGLSPWRDGFEWDGSRVSEGELNDPNFPLCCRASSLTWWPHESRAEAVYDLSAHLEKLNRYTATRMSLADAVFCLMPDNARDMNLNYLAVSSETSLNVLKPDLRRDAVQILHFLHRGGSCGYPGGCNNGSPYQAELDNFRIEALPAHLDVLLWRDRPEDISEPPVMRFTVRFR
ncbi:hypothetical protein LCGC14_1180240 [marine sediment metagenome]|uniref:Uncharacterized protein n=1 Tax=marine sediment metagenome TaxID=412755 RepID=A0A0F9LMD8_9ZZZZ